MDIFVDFIFRALPANVQTGIQTLAAKVRGVLQGEPLRAIVYGAAAVVWLVTHIAVALGYEGFGVPPPTLDAILLAATAASAAITELCRHFVYSPATVQDILNDPTPPVIIPAAADGDTL